MSKFWQTYGMHALSYLVGTALPLVVAYAPAIPKWGFLVAAGASGLITLIHNLQTVASNGAFPAPAQSTIVKALPLLMLVTAISMVSGLSGCAALKSAINTPGASQSIIQDTVEGAVIAGIGVAPQTQRGTIARELIVGAQAVIAVDTNDTATLAQLGTLVAQRLVQTKLDPALQAVLNDVVSNAVNLLAAKVSSGTLPGSTAVTVNTVLNWIIAGATPYSTAP